MTMGLQMPLALKLRDDATFANFYPGENVAVLAQLQTFSEVFIYLCGPKGSGRTHLLQACCHALPAGQSLYLDLKDPSLTPEILINFEYFNQICIDNIDKVIGQMDWDVALFHFYNRVRDRGGRLLMASECVPLALDCQLPDLQSRLCGGLLLTLQALTDEDKVRALQVRAQHRGLTLSAEAGRFLINHYPRDMNALFTSLEVLDQAAWVAKRPLTIPFIKKHLVASN